MIFLRRLEIVFLIDKTELIYYKNMKAIFNKYNVEQIINDNDECLILDECLENRGNLDNETFAKEFVKIAQNYNDFYYNQLDLVLEYIEMKYNPNNFIFSRN